MCNFKAQETMTLFTGMLKILCQVTIFSLMKETSYQILTSTLLFLTKLVILVPWGTPLYKLYRYVSPDRVGFLRRFGLKTGKHFAHFGLESGMVFEGTTGVYERIYRFNSK